MIQLILSIAMSTIIPYVDGQRWTFDLVPDTPYTLGYYAPDPVEMNVFEFNQQTFEYDLVYGNTVSGLNLDLMEINQRVRIYEGQEFVGEIVPEPCTLSFLITGVFLCRKYAKNRKGK